MKKSPQKLGSYHSWDKWKNEDTARVEDLFREYKGSKRVRQTSRCKDCDAVRVRCKIITKESKNANR